MNEQEREAFLKETRLGILSTLDEGRLPVSVPVWFEWDGQVVRMFSGNDTPKVRRLQADPRGSLLVVNHLREQEAWLAFDGEIAISDEGGLALAERIAPKYWDLSDPARANMLEEWRKGPEAFCLLTLTPSRVRTGS